MDWDQQVLVMREIAKNIQISQPIWLAVLINKNINGCINTVHGKREYAERVVNEVRGADFKKVFSGDEIFDIETWLHETCGYSKAESHTYFGKIMVEMHNTMKGLFNEQKTG